MASITIDTEQSVRRLLADAGQMEPRKVDYILTQTQENGYCPFIFGAVNYCLTLDRAGTYALEDVTAPADDDPPGGG